MRKSARPAAIGVLALLITASALPAQANSVPLEVWNQPEDLAHIQFQVGNLAIWVTGCTISDAGRSLSQDPCNGVGLELASGTGPAEVLIRSASDSNGGHIFDIPANQVPIGDNTYDLSVDLDIFALNGPSMQSDAISITGSAGTLADEQFLTVGETISYFDGISFVNIPAPTASVGEPSTVSFAPQSFIRVHKDIGDQLGAVGTGPIIIDQVAQNFGFAPEPASIGLLLVGLTGLHFMARRKQT